MSQTVLTLSVRKAGVLYDAASVTLESPDTVSPAFGLKRTDTDEILVASGTAYTRIDTGVYQYVLTDPSPGLTYTYWRHYVVDGKSVFEQLSVTALGIEIGQISTTELLTVGDMIATYGETLLARLTSMNSEEGALDTSRLQIAINNALNDLYVVIQTTSYAWPLTNLNEHDVGFLKDALLKRAMSWLYDARPGLHLDDKGKPLDFATPYSKAFVAAMRQIKTRQVPLAADLKTGADVVATGSYVVRNGDWRQSTARPIPVINLLPNS